MIAAAVLAIAQAIAPQETFVARVADDARVIDRVAEASRRDLPRELLRRIVNEDLELLRGRRPDGTYQHATYERMEADRTEGSHSIQPRSADDEKASYTEIKGSFVYRLILSVPSRRMVVTRNRRIFIERVDIEFVPQGGTSARIQSERVEQWLEPGANKVVNLKEIARQATIRVHARADSAGYGNLVLTLVHAKVIDDASSPYAEAVSSLKAILRALDHGDAASIRAMASRIHTSLRPSMPYADTPPSGSTLNVIAPGPSAAASSEFYAELQTIEDLLTGNEVEKREGLDRLHQLIRKLRPR